MLHGESQLGEAFHRGQGRGGHLEVEETTVVHDGWKGLPLPIPGPPWSSSTLLPGLSLEQHDVIDLSAMTEMSYICAVQYSHH